MDAVERPRLCDHQGSETARGIMRFVITGTGRSGTQYIARLLSELGGRVGHEAWFGPRPGLVDEQWMSCPMLAEAKSRVSTEIRRRQRRLEGDVSWMAVPRLSRFRGLVLLQTRDPVRVISSLVARTQFSRATRVDNPWFRFINHYFDVTGDDMLDSMRWYVEWNRRAETHADYVYRLEDLDDGLLERIASLVRIPTNTDMVRSALQSVSRSQNATESYGYDRVRLRWDDLPIGPERAQLAEAAHRYGYSHSG